MHTDRPTACFQIPPFYFLLVSAFCLLAYCLPPFTFASDEPFTYPANWGGTGLMEVPTARVMGENYFRIGAGQVDPYRYFYGVVSPLKGLEIDGRITEGLNVPSGLSNQKNFKDKAIDLKYRFISEGKYSPALAFGIMDPHGTRVYPSQYIVASKQIYPFDFTIGFGNGRFGKKPLAATTKSFKLEILSDPGTWIKDSQFFWGIQFAPSEKYALMLEFNPIKYHIQGDPAQRIFFKEPVPSQYNVGFRYKPTTWSEIDITYQRGNRFGVNLSTTFEMGKPLIPLYDPIHREQPAEKLNNIYDRITDVLHESGFSDIGVIHRNGELWIEAQNEKYFDHAKAIGIILRVLNNITPEDVRKIHIVLKENGIPFVELVTTPEDISDLYKGDLSPGEFLYLSHMNTGVMDLTIKKGAYRKTLRYGFRPSLETFLNDPSGFFKYRFGVSGWTSYHPWNGASLVAALSSHPVNNIETTNNPLSIPVRSDIVLYKEKKVSLSRLMFDQITKLTPAIYGKLSFGLLEEQYGGFDAEVAMPALDGRVFIGLSGSAVKKRDPDNPFKIKSDNAKEYYTTAFLSARLNIHELNAAFDIKAGKFLAGDEGVRFTISKNINGVKLWAWYSITDTSVFSDEYNQGYHDKGIGISIPIRLFKGTDSRTSYYYALAPWTRDTGQDIYHYNNLFDIIEKHAEILLDRSRKLMY